MNPDDADRLVRSMFSAHGANPAPAIITELGVEVARAGCPTCARKVLADNHDDGKRPLTVPTFRGAYYAMQASVEHGLHLGQDERAVSTGELEGFWRGEARDVVRRERPDLDRDQAGYIALSAWWADVEADAAGLAEFVRSNPKWIDGVLAYYLARDDLAAQAEKLASACRQRSTGGLESVDPEALP